MRLLIWLELCKLRNALRHLVRTPMRLVITLFLSAYLLLLLGGQLLLLLVPVPAGRPILFAGLLEDGGRRIGLVTFWTLLAATYQVIVSGLRGGLLAFAAEDVDFLFPAPVPRRSVLLFRLLLDDSKVLAAVFGLLLLLGPQLRFSGAAHVLSALWYTPVALWLYLVLLLNLSHLLNLAWTFHEERFRYLPVGVKLALGLAVAVALYALSHQTAGSAPEEALPALLHSHGAALWLFPLVVTWEGLMAPFAGLPSAAGWKLAGLALLAVGSLVLLVTRRENIYEPTLETSLLRSRVKQAMGSGDAQTARALLASGRRRWRGGSGPAPFGRGAGALLWKGLAIQWRAPLRKIIALAILAAAAPPLVRLLERLIGEPAFVRVSPLLTYYTVVISGNAMLTIQRGELRRANLLKPLPVPAWQVVLTQVLPTALSLALAAEVALTALAVGLPEVDDHLCLLIGLSVPPLTLLIGIAGGAMATVFPDVRDRAQNFIGGTCQLVVAGLLTTPGLVVGAVLWKTGLPAWSIGALMGGVYTVLAGLAVLVAAWLYRRFDPSE